MQNFLLPENSSREETINHGREFSRWCHGTAGILPELQIFPRGHNGVTELLSRPELPGNFATV